MKRTLIVTGVVIVLLGGLYGWMRLDSSRALDTQRDELQGQIDAANEALRQVRADLAAEKAQTRLLVAVTELYQAAAELEARNFGTAEERLRAAAVPLEGMQDPDVTAIRESIVGFKMDVTADVGQQRGTVLELAKRLETRVKKAS